MLPDRWATPRVRLDSAVVHLHDARFDMWALGIDTLRRPHARRPRVRHPDGLGRFDVDVVVGHIVHAITPETCRSRSARHPRRRGRPAPTDPDVTYPYLWDDPGVVRDDVAVDIPADPVPFPRKRLPHHGEPAHSHRRTHQRSRPAIADRAAMGAGRHEPDRPPLRRRRRPLSPHGRRRSSVHCRPATIRTSWSTSTASGGCQSSGSTRPGLRLDPRRPVPPRRNTWSPNTRCCTPATHVSPTPYCSTATPRAGKLSVRFDTGAVIFDVRRWRA